jgi:tetratricopeptide (TPR) repeat protein
MMTISIHDKHRFIEQLKAGQLDRALTLANEMSLKDPENPLGYAMIGDALKQKGELLEATSFYQYSLHKEPDQPGLYLALGEAHVLNGDLAKAYDAYYRALSLSPRDPVTLQKTGGFLVTVGQLDEARTLLEQSLSLGNQQALNTLLELVIYTGERETIQQFLQKYGRILSHIRGDLAVARANFSLGRFSAVIDDLKSKDINNKNDVWKSGYFHLLASSYEMLGDYEAAFDGFTRQNGYFNALYNAQEVEDRMQQIIQQCRMMPELSLDESLKNRPAYSPIFIVGMPRSGTTLIEQILNTSSHVVPGGELHFIEAAFRNYSSGGEQVRSALADMAAWYRDKITFITLNYPFPKTAPRWITDKMPTNFMYLGFIQKCLPDARFIHIRRNHMDNGLSIYKQNFMRSHAYAASFDDIAHFMSIEERVMAHWKHLFPDAVHTVTYEDLVHDFEQQTKELYRFADLEWSEQVRDFYLNKTFSNTASRDQVREPLHARSIGAHRRYAGQMTGFEQELRRYSLFDLA